MLDYTGHSQAIAWTRPHLETLCEQLREKLEQWAGKFAPGSGPVAKKRKVSGKAAKSLAAIREDAGTLEGTLHLLGTEGGAMLGKALSDAVDALASDRSAPTDELLALLFEAIAVLPDYLDRLEVGDSEISIVLLPLINDLQAAAGVATLSDSGLFAPDLEAVEPPDSDGREIDLGNSRAGFEQALLTWLKNPGRNENRIALREAIGVLIHGFPERPDIRRLGRISAAAAEGLAAGAIRPRTALKRLFARVDLMLKQFMPGGKGAGPEEVNSLARGFLFHIALADRGHAETEAIAEAYRLRDLLPDRVELEQARSTVAGRNRSVFVSVASAVQEELSAIKDELDLHLRGEDTPPEHLQELSEMLVSLGETMSMLGLNRISGRIQALAGRLEHLTDDPEDPEILDVARELLLIESGLEDSIRYLGEAPETGDDAAASATLLPPAERVRVMRQLLAEAAIDLQQSKHLLDLLNRGESDAGADAGAMHLLRRISGALIIAELDDAAGLVAACAAFVQRELVGAKQLPGADRMQGLAEALTGLEFYLDSLDHTDDRSSKFLHSAQERLSELGYGPDGQFEGGEISDPDEASEREAPGESRAESEPPKTMPDEEDFDLGEIFLEEFDAEHTAIEELLGRWQDDPGDRDALVAIRRTFHTLKGSGRMTGAEEIGEFAWAVESALNRVIDGHVPADRALPVVVRACAALPALRARYLGETEGLDDQGLAELMEQAGQLAGAETEPEVEPETDRQPETPPGVEAPDLDVEPVPEADAEQPDPTLIQLMINELTEHLSVLESWLTEAQLRGWTSPVDTDLIRSVHTMKGTLRLAPIADEADAAEAAEYFLQELFEQNETPDSRGLDLLRRVEALLRVRLADLAGETVAPEAFRSTELTAAIAEQLHHVRESASRRPGFMPPSVPGEDVFAFDSPEPDGRPLEETPPVSTPEEFEPVAEKLTEPEEESETRESVESGEATESREYVEAEEAAEAGQETEAEEAAEAEDAPKPEEQAEWAEETGLEAPAESEEAFVTAESTEPAFDLQKPEPEPEPEAISIDYGSLDRELVAIFRQESSDLLEHSDNLLHGWREDLGNRGTVTALQRNLHTIKGSARMAGLDPIGELAHAMEEVLEAIADGTVGPTKVTVDALELGCDRLHAMLEAVAREEALPPVDLSQITAAAAAEIEPARMAEGGEITDDRQAAGEARDDTLRIDAGLLDNLVNFAGEISIFRSRLEQQINLFQQNVGEVDTTVIRLREQLRKLEIETEAQILARYEREHGPTSEFDPLELDRYSTIQQLSRSLAESAADLTSLTEILDEAARQSETLLMQQSRVNTELQEGLMQARLVAFATLAPRLRRVVRNAARDTGKQAQLMIDLRGEGQLDRNILDRVAAPLEHMLRNAVAHGIEAPDERAKAGKPGAGTIAIEVDREATELVIRVSDDGAGLDVSAIRNTAVRRGLLNERSKASDDEIARLIFEPGFTTAGEISELAGRGVGMDVAASEVRQIGGSITVHTETGRGTRFSIRIPLTLAVMQAILVRAEERSFAVPLQVVRGVSRILAADFRNAIAEPDPVYEYGGESYPLMELEPQLGLQAEEVSGGSLSLVMIQAGEMRAAVRVSELIGHREIVVKPVGPQVSSIAGILGGTIAADGQVVLILDMGPLIRRALFEGAPSAAALEIPSEAEVKRAPLIMVVDDSITMRRITSRVLEQHDLEVITAKDGLDAVEILHERIPDIMLLDIEMPRMDGFELAGHVRADTRLKHIPMMMITSRTGEKHRRHAREVGVDRYLSKPYQESELVKNVFEMLKAEPLKVRE